MNLAFDRDASRAHSRRSLTLLALGAAAGLAIAAYGLFSTSGARPNAPPPEAMALVNGRPILRSDFVAQTESESGVDFDHTTMEQRAKVLEEMVVEELYVQRGLELDLAGSDPDVRTAMVAGVQQQVAAEATADMPDDATLRDYFSTHGDKYASEGIMRVRDLVWKGQDEDAPAHAAEAVAALRSGSDVDAAISRFGLTEPARVDSRSFDFAVRARLGDSLFAVAAGLAAGAISDPVAAPDGHHVLVMLERRPSTTLSFEQAHDRLVADFVAEKKARLLDSEIRYLRGKADILLSADAQK